MDDDDGGPASGGQGPKSTHKGIGARNSGTQCEETVHKRAETTLFADYRVRQSGGCSLARQRAQHKAQARYTREDRDKPQPRPGLCKIVPRSRPRQAPTDQAEGPLGPLSPLCWEAEHHCSKRKETKLTRWVYGKVGRSHPQEAGPFAHVHTYVSRNNNPNSRTVHWQGPWGCGSNETAEDAPAETRAGPEPRPRGDE
jgi:hypothetical protein